jgi:predicted exporter
MFNRGDAYNNWTRSQTAEECYSEAAENGCQIEVRAREGASGVEVLVCVYAADGERVVERMETLSQDEWTVEDALQRGRDQAERIAGGESGRLPCADTGQRQTE